MDLLGARARSQRWSETGVNGVLLELRVPGLSAVEPPADPDRDHRQRHDEEYVTPVLRSEGGENGPNGDGGDAGHPRVRGVLNAQAESALFHRVPLHQRGDFDGFAGATKHVLDPLQNYHVPDGRGEEGQPGQDREDEVAKRDDAVAIFTGPAVAAAVEPLTGRQRKCCYQHGHDGADDAGLAGGEVELHDHGGQHEVEDLPGDGVHPVHQEQEHQGADGHRRRAPELPDLGRYCAVLACGGNGRC